MARMYGTHITPEERDAGRDRVAARFLEVNRVLRGFDFLDRDGFAAMIDSETAEDGQTFVWVGRWREQPDGVVPPVVEIAVADSVEQLRARRPHTTASHSADEMRPTLRGRNGEIAALSPVSSPGFSYAWVGEIDGAVVGVFCRSAIRPGVIIAERADVRPLVGNWRSLVDGLGIAH